MPARIYGSSGIVPPNTTAAQPGQRMSTELSLPGACLAVAARLGACYVVRPVAVKWLTVGYRGHIVPDERDKLQLLLADSAPTRDETREKMTKMQTPQATAQRFLLAIALPAMLFLAGAFEATASAHPFCDYTVSKSCAYEYVGGVNIKLSFYTVNGNDDTLNYCLKKDANKQCGRMFIKASKDQGFGIYVFTINNWIDGKIAPINWSDSKQKIGNMKVKFTAGATTKDNTIKLEAVRDISDHSFLLQSGDRDEVLHWACAPSSCGKKGSAGDD